MSPIHNQSDTGFVGADFADLPGISVFGAFARIVRLNHINSKGYFSAFTLRNRHSDDLFHRLTFNESSRNAAAKALSLTSEATLELASWLPFKCRSDIFAANWSFRYCPVCLRHGFHSFLHQLPWISSCPWHHSRLLTACAICGSPLTLSGGSERRLLECCNGHDHFSEVTSCIDQFDQAATATAFIDSYLTWAKKEKARWILIPPEGGTTNFDVIGSAITLPRALRDRCQEPALTRSTAHARTFTIRSKSTNDVCDLSSAFAKLSALSNHSVGMELPKILAPGFVKISCELADRLPPESLTDSEVSLFFDGLERQPDGAFKPAKRSSLAEIRFLPPLLIGDRRVIHLSTLCKTATRVAECLLVLAPIDTSQTDIQIEAGQRLLLRAIGAILKRAYAEGMRVVLSRYVLSLFDSKRDRPRLTEPWVLMQLAGQKLQEVKILWVKRKGLP